jgi:hypothetical protein
MTVAVRRIWDQKRAMRTGEGIREVHTDDRPRWKAAEGGTALHLVGRLG